MISVMKRIVLKLVLPILVVAITTIALTVTYMHRREIDLGDRTVTIIIQQGDSFAKISDALVDSSVVAPKLILRAYAKYEGVDTRLTPGRYDFAGRNSIKSVLERLRTADFFRIKVTIPEGATIWKVASILSERMGFDSASFIALNADSAFLDSLSLPSLEGYLFPETYFFPWGIDLRQAARDMVGQHHRLTEDLWPSEIMLGMSRYDILKLASIVEAETSVDDERGLVASVYINRLREKMRLDADPTVIYGLGGLNRPLYRKDLKYNSPYNTYIYRGLPPTPINSPGLASIKAALNPESTDYYYFVADETGGHHFSRTNAEHNRAIRRIRSGGKTSP